MRWTCSGGNIPTNWCICPKVFRINLLVEASTGLEPNRQFYYQFGGISLRSTFNHAEIHREMALSDLF